jgi:hypothetical protein
MRRSEYMDSFSSEMGNGSLRSLYDKLYISAPDYDDCDDERRAVWDRSHSRLDPEVSREEYRKTFQSGSDALFYGSCADQNETWVPLIEKAFAKAHGDYNAIDGGWPGSVSL